MKVTNVLMLVLILLALIIVPSTAAPSVGSCVPGTVYDPACDVNHDGMVNIVDIQLAAGHWNQSGPWGSDNNHTHIGQTWTGNNNSLRLVGSYGAPDYAPLVLSNTTDDGLNISSAGGNGMTVWSAGDNGVYVWSAGLDGMTVHSVNNDGLFVGVAGDDGVHVGDAGDVGFEVWSAGSIGVYANAAPANGQWGIYTPDRIYGTIGMFSALSLVAQVSGLDGLTPGDLVAVVGRVDPLPGSTAPLPSVRLADGTFTGIIGVVESRLVLTSRLHRSSAEASEAPVEPRAPELRNANGPARAGDYVAVTVLGAVQVKVERAPVIEAGQQLTVSSQPGHARALRTVQVEGITLNEGGPTLGIALEAAKDGLVWVMVNP